jgi:hypothetical protein
MPSDSERAKILEMIADGTITAAEGAKLLDALEDTLELSTSPEVEANPQIVEATSSFSDEIPDDFGTDEYFTEPEEVLEPDDIYDPPPVAPDPGDIQKWKRWWVIPMWVGVGITVLGGALMYVAFDRSGLGFWFACAWFPFMLGVLVMALAWGSRTVPWLHVRVHQKPGETPQKIAISFPLPIRLAGWGLKTFGHYIPNMDGVDLAELVKAIDESAKDGTPFFVDVDDDDGERVQVFIG